MIARLVGEVVELNGQMLILDVNGVGYEVYCSRELCSKLSLGSKAELVIFTEVREDSLRLFGFNDKLEKQVFTLLQTVQGVGAKSAMAILSMVDCADLLRAIGRGEVKRLTAVKGIGKKVAERILVELKDKVTEFALGVSAGENRLDFDVAGEPDIIEDAMLALQALGFAKVEAEKALKSAVSSGVSGMKDSSVLVKEALRFV